MSILDKIYFWYNKTLMMLKLQGNALHTSCIIYKKGVDLILEFGPVFYLKANTNLSIDRFGER